MYAGLLINLPALDCIFEIYCRHCCIIPEAPRAQPFQTWERNIGPTKFELKLETKFFEIFELLFGERAGSRGK